MANTFDQSYTINREKRNKRNGHDSFLILFTGLSGAGKSVLANALEIELFGQDIDTYTLDGDNIRQGICNDLEFSEEDRTENLRRVAEIAKLFIDAGKVTIAAFVSPYEKTREMIKSIVGAENYVEIYVSTSLEECERRDTKGLYAKARKGLIDDFTGISSPYEIPNNPDLTINTEETPVDEAVDKIQLLLQNRLNLQL